MRFASLIFALALAMLIAPLALIAATAIADPTSWSAWGEWDRLVSLFLNTLALAALASLVAVPVGTLAAFILERAAVPGASIFRGLVLVSLFVPLPVVAVAWQVVLGSWLPSLAMTPGDVAWRPWSQGLLPASIVHGLAAMPWVIVIVSAGLRTSDRALEEEALVTRGPTTTIRLVLLPRALLAALAALGWVCVQTSTEIPVTDAMMVRTFGEEVYTQIVGFPAGVNGAVIVSLPVLLAAMIWATLLTKWLMKRFPHNPEPTTQSRSLRFPMRTRYAFTAFLFALFIVGVGLPLAALVWKAAGGGTKPVVSLPFALEQVIQEVELNGRVLLQSLVAAALTGIIAAWLATALAWAARDSKWKANVLLIAAVILALTPGPILGQGLKESIQYLLAGEERLLAAMNWSPTFPPLRSLLYDQPSPIPALLAGLLRFLPVALLIVAPVIRSLPRDLLELAALDGQSAWRNVGRPALVRATALAALAVAGLTLGEVSASKLVAPPGYQLFILDLFNQMHYGAEPTVAALCLIQIAMTAIAIAIAKWLRP